MKSIKKIMLLLCTMSSFLLSVPIYAETTIELVDEVNYYSIEESGTYSSDEIIYYYRTYEGKVQYRRWNATRGFWVDATWLDLPAA